MRHYTPFVVGVWPCIPLSDEEMEEHRLVVAGNNSTITYRIIRCWHLQRQPRQPQRYAVILQISINRLVFASTNISLPVLLDTPPLTRE